MISGMTAWGIGVLGLMVTAPAFAAEPAAMTEQAHVQVELEPEDVSLVGRLARPNLGAGATALQREGYDWLCGGKCELVLPPGRHGFSLTKDNATIASPSELDIPAGRSTLRGSYEKASTVLPWVLIGTSPVTWYAGLLIMKGVNGGEAVSGGQVALGTGLALAQLTVGILLLTRSTDSARFTLVPAAAVPAPLLSDRERTAAQNPLHGVSLQLAF
jgi:hypothetical protein